jgi:hypothetical protein
MMSSMNSQSYESVKTNIPVNLPALVDALDSPGFEPPTLEEWNRAVRGLAAAFLRQVSGDNNCVVESRLMAAHKLIEAWHGTTH